MGDGKAFGVTLVLCHASIPREVVQIQITDEERISGVLELAKLQEALITLHTDGISSVYH